MRCKVEGCGQQAELVVDPKSEATKFKMFESPSETYSFMRRVKPLDCCYYHMRFTPHKPVTKTYNPLNQLF